MFKKSLGFLLSAVLCVSMVLAMPNTKAAAATATSTITLDSSQTYQTMDGFGTSGDLQFSLPLTISGMNPNKQQEILDLLFNPQTGVGFNILRMEAPVGYYYGAEYPDAYTIVDPNTPVPTSPNQQPTYQWDGSANQLVWWCQQAKARGADTFYLDSWTAPAYMKTNNSLLNGGYLKSGWETAYAKWLVQYVRDFASAGVNLSYIGPVNEPDYAAWYQSMQITSPQLRDLIKALGNELNTSGFGNVKIAAAEGLDFNNSASLLQDTFADPTALSYLGVATGHAYGGPEKVAAMPQATAAGIHTWMSEFAPMDANDTWNPNYTGYLGGEYNSDLILQMLNRGVSAYLNWGPQGENGYPNQHLIRIDDANTYDVSKRLWVFANYARFIRLGAVRIGAQSSNINVEVTDFQNTDGSNALVAINKTDSPVDVQINNVQGGTVTSYVTNDTSALVSQGTASVGQNGITVTIPARSTVTYKFVGSTVTANTSPAYVGVEGCNWPPLSEKFTDPNWADWNVVGITSPLNSMITLSNAASFSNHPEWMMLQAQAKNAYVNFTFTGTGFRWLYGGRGGNDGIAQVYVDNKLIDTVDTTKGPGTDIIWNYLSLTPDTPINMYYQKTGLSYGQHVVKVVLSAGSYMVTNGFAYQSDYTAVEGCNWPPNPEKYTDANWAGWNVVGVTSPLNPIMTLSNPASFSTHPEWMMLQAQGIGAYVDFTFYGTGFRWLYGGRGGNDGIAQVYVDGALLDTVDSQKGPGTAIIWNYLDLTPDTPIDMYYQKTGLSYGQHTVRIMLSSGSYLVTNGFAYK